MIKENVKKLLSELPEGIALVAAVKERSVEEILEVVGAGIKIVGENYVQEAYEAFNIIGRKVRWHFIGHLQRNKVRKAVEIFDMIETVDSFQIAREINRISNEMNKIMPVLIEINSGKEKQKFGVLPENVEEIIREIHNFKNIKIMGLMTMGPRSGNPEDARSYFVETRKIFERIKSLNLPCVEMKYLSMGMTNTYQIAIKEGANIIRIGTKIFGGR